MKEHIITVIGLLGGIFDCSVKYLLDSSNSIDSIGEIQVINQSASSLSAKRVGGTIMLKNTSTSSNYCYGAARNKTPIDINGYKYLYIEFDSYFYTTAYDSQKHANEVQLRLKPDLSNDTFTTPVSNNINIGTATITITAKDDSEKIK